MTRSFPLLVMSLCLALALAPPASARRGPGEDLRPLPAARQVDLIEREYAAQSRGRTIPDDQLAYYLDQVQDGWGMGQVRQDIGHSLQGRGGRHWNGSSWSGQTLVCSSTDRKRRQCRTPFNGRPVLVENISGTRCVEGRNFGGGGGTMWVDDGCRGRFGEGRGGWQSGQSGSDLVRCESRDNRQQACAFRGRAVLVRQLSSAACIEGRTWGQRGDTLWVDDGCRGEFAQGRGGAGNRPGIGNSGYSVTCNSDDRRRRSCAWDRRQGRPVVVQQISGTRCEENRNWGWNGGSIWVDGGCRARFGAR